MLFIFSMIHLLYLLTEMQLVSKYFPQFFELYEKLGYFGKNLGDQEIFTKIQETSGKIRRVGISV